jgi:hypothetical protein
MGQSVDMDTMTTLTFGRRAFAAHAVPLAALAGTVWLAFSMAQAVPGVPAAAPSTGHDLVAMAQRLATRLDAAGAPAQDPQAWALLARSHVALGAHAQADSAYARALQADALADADRAALLAERAQVRVLGGAAPGHSDVRAWVAQALLAQPRQALALALDGDAAYERGELSTARTRWLDAQAACDPLDAELAAALARRLGTLDAAARLLAPR